MGQKKPKVDAALYDPVTQKPTRLGDRSTVPPKIFYYGPPPDAGTTYGVYACEACKAKVLSDLQDSRYCPHCSTKMKVVGKMIAPESKKHQAVTAHVSARLEKSPTGLITCVCGGKMMASSKEKPVHCVNCGKEITAQQEDGDEPTETEISYEAVVHPVDIEGMTFQAEDVAMALFDVEGEDPFWNIDLKGRPLAQIRLSDQPRPDEVRATFVSERYRDGLCKIVERVPLHDVLTQTRARYWAAVSDERAQVKEIRASAKEDGLLKAKQLFEDYKDSFLACLGLVTAGMDKNFFDEEGNPLKDAFYAEMTKIGVPEAQSVDLIESAFEGGSGQYFEAVFQKATEYMDLTPQAFAEIQQAIAGASALVDGVASSETTLAAHMAAGSLNVTNVDGGSGSESYEERKRRAKDAYVKGVHQRSLRR